MSDLDDMMRQDTPATEDRLKTIRATIRDHRDTCWEITELESRLASLKRERLKMEHETLPDMLATAGVHSLTVEAEGNRPAIEAKLLPYYRAVIVADWPEEKRDRAFDVLENLGLGSIVKCVIEIAFDKDDDESRLSVMELLREHNIAYSACLSVHWKTLTAAVQEIYESGKTLPAPVLDAIGATVGRVVKLKEKDK